ncbi:MAG: high-potential iron-sulfur protein [Halapricum sp.]
MAGCSSGGGGDSVPDAYRTATSLGGSERDPDALSSKRAVGYRDHPQGDLQCSNCQYYIEDKNGDGMGACALVAGTIDPEGYCATYVRYED